MFKSALSTSRCDVRRTRLTSAVVCLLSVLCGKTSAQTIHVVGSNVGIGTTGPYTVLDVYASGASDPFRARGTTHNAWINLNSGQGLFLAGQYADAPNPARDGVHLFLRGSYWDGSVVRNADTVIGTFVSGNNSYRMAFRTANTERMAIDQSGNVGIGTTTPNEPLEVVAGNVHGIRIKSTSNAPVLDFYTSGSATARNWSIASNYNQGGHLEFMVSADNTSAPRTA